MSRACCATCRLEPCSLVESLVNARPQLAAEDALKQRRFRFEKDFQFAAVEENSAAWLRGADVDKDPLIVLFLQLRTAFRAAHPVFFLLVSGFELGPLGLGLCPKLGNLLLILAVEIFVFLAIALAFQIVFQVHLAFQVHVIEAVRAAGPYAAGLRTMEAASAGPRRVILKPFLVS